VGYGRSHVRLSLLAVMAPVLTLTSMTPLAADPPSARSEPPRIALTFDDGPSAKYTPQLLDILRKHDARATFFILGALVKGNRQVLQRAEAEGHEIALHSWWHADYTRLSDASIAADIARCEDALTGVIDGPVRWLRPPYGAANARVRAAIARAGYGVAMWSVDPRDWQRPGSSAIASRILSRAHDGAVVVLHDGGGNRAGTVAAMKTVIPALQERGYRLVTLSELRGLTEPSDRGTVLTLGQERFELHTGFDDVTVRVDARDVEVAEPPLMIREQFLVHARPVLQALGAGVAWDAEDLTVTIVSSRGEFRVRLNSLEVQRDGVPLTVRVPSVYHRQQAMLPAWLIANICGAHVEFNEEERVIEFTTRDLASTVRRPARPTAIPLTPGAHVRALI